MRHEGDDPEAEAPASRDGAGEEPTGDRRPPSTWNPAAATFLATEHWSLLGTRSMLWNEALTRITVLLTIVSASIVALALVGDATGFDGSFSVFALVLLPAVLFLGLATYARLLQITDQEGILVQGMNRLRRAYLDAAPELAPYFTASPHDDARGVLATITMGKPAPLPPWGHLLVDPPTIVATVNAVLAAAAAGMVARTLGAATAAVVAVSTGGFVVTWGALLAVQVGARRSAVRGTVARFPTPESQEAGSGSG